MIGLVLVVAGLGLATGTIDPGTPPCPPEVEHHHRIRFWLTPSATGATDATDAAEHAFLQAQVARANGLFVGIDTCFEAIAERLDAAPRVTTRAERDALGKGRFAPGEVHVFVVDRLDDVDEPADADGELVQIRGVHWRDRADRARRWIILSRVAPPHVLAHELGHFFSLPHGTDPTSIMNKTWRATPREEERVFTRTELTRMKGAAKRMRRSRFLIDLPKS
ncbi:MAG: hypothetical protein IT385_27440 [Deltaproteobacteria bacterium]|nr:hypothetical protein [Deltaproteobacteria bacterium]